MLGPGRVEGRPQEGLPLIWGEDREEEWPGQRTRPLLPGGHSRGWGAPGAPGPACSFPSRRDAGPRAAAGGAAAAALQAAAVRRAPDLRPPARPARWTPSSPRRPPARSAASAGERASAPTDCNGQREGPGLRPLPALRVRIPSGAQSGRRGCSLPAQRPALRTRLQYADLPPRRTLRPASSWTRASGVGGWRGLPLSTEADRRERLRLPDLDI